MDFGGGGGGGSGYDGVAAVPFGLILPVGVRQHNGRLPYTADNGRKLQADNHMTSWNVAAQPEGDAEQGRQNRSDLSETVGKSG